MKQSDYMHWAKTGSQARFNLAASGVAPVPISELKFAPEDLALHGENAYGFRPLQERIARRYDVTSDNVVESAGTSMANHLAMASILEAGDEVLIEHPTYGLIVDVARYLGAEIKRFRRREENGWSLEVEAVRKSLTPRTRLIIVTNLHNPTSVLAPEAVLREIGELASTVGALVLVDEVYLELIYERPPRSAFHLGSNFLVTRSLTKGYGLSGLRCGWILAQPELAWKMRRLNDLFGSLPVHIGELLSVVALDQLDRLRERARRLVETDRKAFDAFLEKEPKLVAVPTNWGTTSFPRLRDGGTDKFVDLLRREFDTSVVPGRFFEMPDHFRVGFGMDNVNFAAGLERMEEALNGDRAP
jgi:aspartate/methionine/tyrosine aminotransferase